MYCLYGIVGKSRDLLHKSLKYPGACVVHLEQGIGMIPISEGLLNDIEQDDSSLGATKEPGFEFLSNVVSAWVQSLSQGMTLAYLEAEFISGEGTESAVVWRDGVRVLGPLHGTGAVNRALRTLGVSVPSRREEFEVVGLGKHRNPEEWLKELH
jgi:hypothetical protein